MLTVIPGVSEEKAATIVRMYPSIKALMTAYRECSSIDERENMLKDLIVASFTAKKDSKIGKAISKKVYQFLTSKDPELVL